MNELQSPSPSRPSAPPRPAKPAVAPAADAAPSPNKHITVLLGVTAGVFAAVGVAVVVYIGLKFLPASSPAVAVNSPETKRSLPKVSPVIETTPNVSFDFDGSPSPLPALGPPS